MHKLIKETLEKNFKILNNNLVNGDDHSKLDLVIDTIKQAATGEMYKNDIAKIFTNHPIIYSPQVQESVLSILDLIDGIHPLVKSCCEEENQKSPLGYRCALTEEIITGVNFFSVRDNGDIITNNVPIMSFISEVEAMGNLSITEPNNEL